MKRLHISLIIIIIMTITINPASPWPSAGQHPRLIAEMMADRAEQSLAWYSGIIIGCQSLAKNNNNNDSVQ